MRIRLIRKRNKNTRRKKENYFQNNLIFFRYYILKNFEIFSLYILYIYIYIYIRYIIVFLLYLTQGI
jgi:hypothetical protein